jgi:hypothetical protein
MSSRDVPDREPPGRSPTAREAESALRRLGYARVPGQGGGGAAPPPPSFWVQEPGVPRRLYPVFLEERVAERFVGAERRPAILVVPDDRRAEAAWRQLRGPSGLRSAPELSILVLQASEAGREEAHWHSGTIERRELLELATGVIVGMFRRAAGEVEGGQVDFEEMLQILRQRFHIDLESTLGVESDEDQLWMMYQLANRFSYAPGDPASNLHLLVLKPTGPPARLPWFAA